MNKLGALKANLTFLPATHNSNVLVRQMRHQMPLWLLRSARERAVMSWNPVHFVIEANNSEEDPFVCQSNIFYLYLVTQSYCLAVLTLLQICIK